MKTNYALAAIVETDDPEVGSIIHTCWYEKPPTQHDVDALVEELRTDEEFGMTHMVCDEDYFLHELSEKQIRQAKELQGIPDDLEGSGEL